MSGPRLRFAPSPSGYLHIGGARTALYNWLWARHTGGSFVVRVEDTDQERSSEESVKTILDSMEWLGMDWDEGPRKGGDFGPYFQSDRKALYAEFAEKIIESGHAYRCYATKEEIQSARAEFEAAGGKGFRFQSPWRDKKEELDKPFVVRFRAPSEGKTSFVDLIRGKIEFEHETLQDSILLRADGLPLYNFGCFVDDLTMGITLVSRGDDHIINTPNQILLYEAIGEKPPEFAHLPMVLGPDGKRFSKRHGAVSVLEYQKQGFLPSAMMNYLARLGWSHGDQEIFSVDDLIAKFGWDHCGKTGSRFDTTKLRSVQEEHVRPQDHKKTGELAMPFLKARGLVVDPNDPKLALAIGYIKPRIATLEEVADHVDYFFREPPEFDEKAQRKFMKPEKVEYLPALIDVLEAATDFTAEPLHQAVEQWMEKNELKMKAFAQAARVALSGRTRSPSLFEVMEVLGKERTIARLRAGIKMAEEAPVED